jgi:hypothetical protein
MRVKSIALLCLLMLCVEARALKSRERTFTQDCDSVWKAAVAVAKTEQYRIISISKEEQIISVSAGGVWSGERIISLSLSSRGDHGCTATAQSRFSGLAHSDGPDLLLRVYVELIAETTDRDSKAFHKFKACMEGHGDESKCEEHFRKSLTRPENAAKSESPSSAWWQLTK